MLEHLTRSTVTMNKLSTEKRAAIIRALTEGNSIRGTARMVGVSKTTVLKLLVEVGEFCAFYHDQRVRNVPATRIEADEIWAFVGTKQKNAEGPQQGDLWTFTAIDPDSKMIVSYLVGHRAAMDAYYFMADLKERLANRVQLTTDGHHMYLSAVEHAFGWNGVDYAMLQKHYSQNPEGRRRYSPAKCTGATKKWVMGTPAKELVSTSIVERKNLNIRLYSRRYTRLTNAFSRKVENHEHAMALHFFVHNFCRAHTTLTKKANGVKTNPAMAAGLTDRVLKIEDLLTMMDPKAPLQSK